MNRKLPNSIKALRALRNMTQLALGKKIGRTQQWVSFVEDGIVTPRPAQLASIAKAFKVFDVVLSIMTEADRIKLDSLQKDRELEAFVWQVLDYARTHHLTGQNMRDIFTAGIVHCPKEIATHMRKMKDSA